MEKDANCPNDYIEILDGLYGSSVVITRLCGFTLQDVDEKTFVSSSNMLLVHMHTDNDKENRGFLAKHKGIKLLNYVNRNQERRNADIYQIPEFLSVKRGCLIPFAEKAKYRKPSGKVLTSKTTCSCFLAFYEYSEDPAT